MVEEDHDCGCTDACGVCGPQVLVSHTPPVLAHTTEVRLCRVCERQVDPSVVCADAECPEARAREIRTAALNTPFILGI